MPDRPTDAMPLADLLAEAMALLRDHAGPSDQLPLAVSDAFSSLLAQCEALCDTAATAAPPPVRTLHHLACTGGTLIAKCIAALPNTVVLSEMDPLSKINLGGSRAKAVFTPADIITQLHYSRHDASANLIGDIFLGGLEKLYDQLCREGCQLVLRVHCHSRYCTAVDPASRPGLRDMLLPHHSLRSVLTVRHPLASYLSLVNNGWVHFTPATAEEYARRYLIFLDDQADLPILRYEDFLAEPAQVLGTICGHLELPFDPLALQTQSVLRMSGDSGRSGAEIRPRPPRPAPPDLVAALNQSPGFKRLCQRLDYALEA